MSKNTYADLMKGRKDYNIRFADIQRLLNNLGFSYRIKGDHFIYWRDDILVPGEEPSYSMTFTITKDA